MGAENLCHLGRCPEDCGRFGQAARRRPCRSWLGRRWDDLPLRYLPTNLSGPEIAGELYVSFNTVKTHVRNLYAKLGTHHRTETVTRARDLGLLAPSPRSAR